MNDYERTDDYEKSLKAQSRKEVMNEMEDRDNRMYALLAAASVYEGSFGRYSSGNVIELARNFEFYLKNG